MIRTRSLVARHGVQVATPLAILIGTYLLLAGHNNPGGGFAAGLVFGAVAVLRTVVGLQRPTGAVALIAMGICVVVAVAALPLMWGDGLLDQQIWSAELPLMGKVKSGTALPFDIGVTAIVVGVVLALVDGLGGTSLGHGSPEEAPQ